MASVCNLPNKFFFSFNLLVEYTLNHHENNSLSRIPFKNLSKCARYSLSCTFDNFSKSKKFNGVSKFRSKGFI
jgi:hypothetical protein